MTIKSILLVGNCVIDQIFTVSHYPSEDEELRAQAMAIAIGGNACNSAQILAQLGFRVELMSSMAQDIESQWLIQQLQARHISTGLCQYHADGKTPRSNIWLNRQNGSRSIVHYRDLAELDLASFEKIDGSAYQWIHFEGRNVETLVKVLPELARCEVPISLEMEKNRPQLEQLLPHVTSVIVSSAYLQQTGISASDCVQHIRRINPRLNIVCTLGQSGSIASDASGNIITTEAQQVSSVVDSIGAGDCFIAGLISQLAQDQNLPAALSYANQLAANKIKQQGMNIDV
jgi:ketohexokinase